ncbi:MAG TPA: hypothetical protein VM759_00560 [Longimicrobium sp.]|nr:hypothetical protein [Longimicrobium sp.]
MADVPALPLAAPQVAILSDSAVENGRRIRLRITSPRGAERLGLNVEEAVPVGEVEVNGRAPARPGPFTGGAGQRVVGYHAVPPEGIEVAFTVRSTEPITLRVTDTSYGLPDIPGGISPRPEGMMSKPFILTDVTMASRTLRI